MVTLIAGWGVAALLVWAAFVWPPNRRERARLARLDEFEEELDAAVRRFNIMHKRFKSLEGHVYGEMRVLEIPPESVTFSRVPGGDLDPGDEATPIDAGPLVPGWTEEAELDFQARTKRNAIGGNHG